MKSRNFTLINLDTDSLTICKPDMSEFTPQEIDSLTEELNSLFPENISWEDDGYYPAYCVLKAKNYILYDGKKIKMKGSGIRDQKKEPALREMLDTMINDIILNDSKTLLQIYEQYIREAMNPTDITRWAQKKTLTKSVLNCATDMEARTNEKVVWDAVKGKNLQEGDKFYVYPVILSETDVITGETKTGKVKTKKEIVTGLKCAEDWNGDHDVNKLVSRVVKTLNILANVVDMSLFINYSLVKNRALLSDL